MERQGQGRAWSSRVYVWSMLGVAAAACAGGQPADPRHVAMEEQRLLRPYLEGAAGMQVGCEELTITMTPNFVTRVSQPAVDARAHKATKQEKEEYSETEWINITGDPRSAFVVTVADTDLDAQISTGKLSERRGITFRVLRAYRVRVLQGRHALALEADTHGAVFTVENGQARDLREFRITDGALQAR
jgi:hypothetical protein